MEIERKILITVKTTVHDVPAAAKMMVVPESAVEESINLRMQEVAEALAEDYSEEAEEFGAFTIKVDAEVVCPN